MHRSKSAIGLDTQTVGLAYEDLRSKKLLAAAQKDSKHVSSLIEIGATELR